MEKQRLPRLSRYRTKEIRERKLQEYDTYKNEHPRKCRWLFWSYIILPVAILILLVVTTNTVN